LSAVQQTLTETKAETEADYHALYHALLRVLIHSQLQGYIAYRVDDLSPYPEPFKRHLTSVRTFSSAQYLQVLQACRTIADDLDAANTPILLMKGAAYIVTNKANAKGRLISDIDILVEKDQLSEIESRLQANGWQAKELDDYDEKYYRDWSHELPPYFHLETGVTLDIHHNLLPGSAGKTIDIKRIFKDKQATDTPLFALDDRHLILHSAIHLLLNDDIEKGLRDCLDLHQMLISYVNNNDINELHSLFIDSGCEGEFYILIGLLNILFKEHSLPYCASFLDSQALKKHQQHATDFSLAVFPNSEYLADSSNTLVRFKVYVRGHLSKMPIIKFIKHMIYKSYRTLVKKTFGEFIFRK
jgi:hypothetical protein